MESTTLSYTERSDQFKRLLKAARSSVVRVSLCFAFYGAMRGGLEGAVWTYLYAAAISTVGMCVFALIALPVILNSEREISPAIFSLVAMGIFACLAYMFTVYIMNGSWVPNSVQLLVVLLGMLYGAPLGFYMRRQN